MYKYCNIEIIMLMSEIHMLTNRLTTITLLHTNVWAKINRYVL